MCEGPHIPIPLTFEEYRKNLQTLISRGHTLTDLAERLGKSRTRLQRVLGGDRCKCPMLTGGGIDHIKGCKDR